MIKDFKKYRKAFIVIGDNIMFAKPGLKSHEAFVESAQLTESEWENSIRGYVWGDTLVLYTYDETTYNIYGSSSELVYYVDVLRQFIPYINCIFLGMEVNDDGVVPIYMYDEQSGRIMPVPDNWSDYFFSPFKYQIIIPDYVNDDYRCFIEDICLGTDGVYKLEDESSDDVITVVVTSTIANHTLLKLHYYDAIVSMKEVSYES